MRRHRAMKAIDLSCVLCCVQSSRKGKRCYRTNESAHINIVKSRSLMALDTLQQHRMKSSSLKLHITTLFLAAAFFMDGVTYGQGVETGSLPGVSFVSSVAGGGGDTGAAAALAASLTGLTREQINEQLASLRTGDVVSINNVQYVALRSENDRKTSNDGKQHSTTILIGRRDPGGELDPLTRTQRDSYTNFFNSLSAASANKDRESGVGFFSASADKMLSTTSYDAPLSSPIVRPSSETVVAENSSAGAVNNLHHHNHQTDPNSYSTPHQQQQLQQSSVNVLPSHHHYDSSSKSISSLGNYDGHHQQQQQQQQQHDNNGGGYHQPTPATAATNDEHYNTVAATAASQYHHSSGNGEVWDYSHSIPGEAGRDYPILSDATESRSDFSCDGRGEGGYYADVTSRCQVYHVCALRTKFSFLCPNGTVFDQRFSVCNWWHNVDCASSATFYPQVGEVNNDYNRHIQQAKLTYGSLPPAVVPEPPSYNLEPPQQLYKQPQSHAY